MPQLTDTELVQTLKRRIDTIVRDRMDKEKGNNLSVLTSHTVNVTLTMAEIGNRSDQNLLPLLDKVKYHRTVVNKNEASGNTPGIAFTVANIIPGGAVQNFVRVTFSVSPATVYTR